MLRNIENLLKREQQSLVTRKKLNCTKLTHLDDFQQEFQASESEESIVMLGKSQKRHAIVDKGPLRLSKL